MSSTPAPLIALITDFGTRDWYAAAMKGVIHSIHPAARIVDITHEIAPGCIEDAAFVLLASTGAFGKGTIYVIVVDPGVGSGRRPVIMKCAGSFFIAPDNGVLSYLLEHGGKAAVRIISGPRCRRRHVSTTFHGRDIFAPAAAHLSRGMPLREFGPPCPDPVRIPWPAVRRTHRAVAGSVVYIDRFGNAITNIGSEVLPADLSSLRITTGPGRSIRFHRCYQEAGPGRALAVIGSSGFVEISISGGNAAKKMNLKRGTSVRVRECCAPR